MQKLAEAVLILASYRLGTPHCHRVYVFCVPPPDLHGQNELQPFRQPPP